MKIILTQVTKIVSSKTKIPYVVVAGVSVTDGKIVNKIITQEEYTKKKYDLFPVDKESLTAMAEASNAVYDVDFDDRGNLHNIS